jgi:CDP-diacylglycerol--glycerol-3-phosphate 3-phosphatidyltransferase
METRALAKRIPAALVALRAACGPVLLACAALGAGRWLLAALLTVALLSDVFDGIVARRLGVATPLLRRADSLVDTAFYLCATAALATRAPVVLQSHLIGIAILGSLEVSRWVLERFRYGRIASYHMWSAKLWGIALWLGFCEAFLSGRPGPFMQAAVATGILTDLEGLAASLVLSDWHHDVRSIWHAVRMERAGNR